jgi:hypothetical protein
MGEPTNLGKPTSLMCCVNQTLPIVPSSDDVLCKSNITNCSIVPPTKMGVPTKMGEPNNLGKPTNLMMCCVFNKSNITNCTIVLPTWVSQPKYVSQPTWVSQPAIVPQPGSPNLGPQPTWVTQPTWVSQPTYHCGTHGNMVPWYTCTMLPVCVVCVV